MELRLETFALAQALGEVCAVVRPLAEQKAVGLGLEVGPGLAEVRLDEQKLKQICYNLLSNAVKFTGPGGQVALRALAQGGAEQCFELRVSDTGIGIRPEDLGRLFRSFEQLEAGAARRFEGTGLGLALTRRLVELQGGRIEVQSEYGQGTTFSVLLPRCLKK
jgi:signal transduction histidine kinase